MQIALMTCFFIADQVTKAVFGDLRLDLIAPYLRIEPSLNRGLAFSVPVGSFLALTLNTAVLLAVVGYWLRRVGSRESWWLAVMIGGAFGNLVDRLMLGGVVDWFVLNWFGWSESSVNLADAVVLLGAVGWLWNHRKRMPLAATHEAGLKEGEM